MARGDLVVMKTLLIATYLTSIQRCSGDDARGYIAAGQSTDRRADGLRDVRPKSRPHPAADRAVRAAACNTGARLSNSA